MSGDILIIDDSYEDVMILDRLLCEAGYSVRATRSGASGRRAALSKRPDVVLLDIVLPDDDGFAICQQLLAEPLLANVPFIFISALQAVELKARAFESGAVDFIVKPLYGPEVLIRLQHQMERLYLQQAMQENARQNERKRISRELHDSVNQTLFILGASIQALKMDADQMPPAITQQLEYLHQLSQSATAEMRMLLNELRPSQIEDLPMSKLLHQLVDAFRLRMKAEVSVMAMDVALPSAVKHLLYRVTQEALHNASKYANAAHLEVTLVDDGACLHLAIADDGRGFDPNTGATGLGLNLIRERAEQFGMRCDIRSAPNEGTRIEISWER